MCGAYMSTCLFKSSCPHCPWLFLCLMETGLDHWSHYIKNVQSELQVIGKHWQTPSNLGGLAYPDNEEVQKVARKSLTLFDADPTGPGASHTQSQRFLNPEWTGLAGDSTDVALRPLVEAIASGEVSIEDLLNDERPPAKSFLHWVSSFKLVQAWVCRCQTIFSVVYCAVSPSSTKLHMASRLHLGSLGRKIRRGTPFVDTPHTKTFSSCQRLLFEPGIEIWLAQKCCLYHTSVTMQMCVLLVGCQVVYYWYLFYDRYRYPSWKYV